MLQYAPLACPSLENLAYVLRHSEMWPKAFEWHFGRFSCCAVGLAQEFWPDQQYLADEMFREMTTDTFQRIFVNPTTKPPVRMLWWIKRGRRHDEVTPTMVADQIERYLESRRRDV